jgi:hypothetical protein
MDPDAAALTRILTLCTGEEPAGPEEAVLLLRQSQPSLAPTMYSAWAAAGDRLSPALHHELEGQRRRIETYRALSADLATEVPEAIGLKGLEVADLYPAGWVRYMNDLDYVATDEAVLWRLVAAAAGHGFEVDSGTFAIVEGRLHVLVSMRRPHEDPYSLPYGIEVTTYFALGDLAGVPPMLELPAGAGPDAPVVKNLLMLLFERFEQKYRARDLLDGALALTAAGESGRFALGRAAGALGLWPEYAELAALLAEAEIGPPLTVPDRSVVLADRARRASRRLAGFRSPARGAARHLQRRMILGGMARPERWAWSAAQGRLPASWALRAGLQCFGLPVEGGRTGLRVAEIGERPEVCWVDTPAGRFVLAAGDEIAESAVAALPVEPPAVASLAARRAPGAG